MDPAALPCGPDQDLLNGSSQPWMCVADGQLNPFESPRHQTTQEREPKRSILRRPMFDAQPDWSPSIHLLMNTHPE